jgi:hypothetical protein
MGDKAPTDVMHQLWVQVEGVLATIAYSAVVTFILLKIIDVVIGIRVESEGTISTLLTDADIAPIAGRTVRWNLKAVQGSVITDHQGYGQIVAVSPRSEKKERIKLAVGSEFLYMRANEITKVITPKPWCEQY